MEFELEFDLGVEEVEEVEGVEVLDVEFPLNLEFSILTGKLEASVEFISSGLIDESC